MPSHLRVQTQFTPFSAHSTQSSFPHATSPRPQKKQKMTITQTYRLAHSARGKLSSEASRGDHDLRLLVGHANLLDSLMLELQDAENEQEAWFNETMKSSPKAAEEPKHIQWIDQVASQQESEEADDESDADSDDEYDDDALLVTSPISRVRSPPPTRQSAIYEDDEDEDDMDSDDEFDNLDLALVRTRSHQPECPELVHDSDESDDESQPPSPPQQSIDLAEIQQQHGIKAQDFAKSEEELLEDGYFLPQPVSQAPLIAAY